MESDSSVTMDDILLLFPTWEENVWNALQKRQWGTAAAQFSDFIRSLNSEERRQVAWKNVIRGIPAARGELTEKEWSDNVRPFLIRGLLEFATGRMVGDILNSFSAPERIEIFSAFISSVPGETLEEKIQWLGRQKSTSANYFLATPAQCLDARFPNTDKHIPSELAQKKFKALSSSLQQTIFSYDTAETIYRISSENLLNEPKIRAAARAVGHILLGFETPEKAEEEIKRATIIDEKTAQILAREFHSRIFSPLLIDLEEAYEPPEKFMADAQTEPQPEFSFPHPAPFLPEETVVPGISTTSPPGRDRAPFILHEEKPLAAEARKETMRGFSLPFGLFKPKKSEPAAPKASVETPKQVHYSEYRTNLTPSAFDEGFAPPPPPPPSPPPAAISRLSPVPPPEPPKFAQEALAPQIIKPLPTDPLAQATAKPIESSNVTVKKSTEPLPKGPPPRSGDSPAIEGNTIDLR